MRSIILDSAYPVGSYARFYPLNGRPARTADLVWQTPSPARPTSPLGGTLGSTPHPSYD